MTEAVIVILVLVLVIVVTTSALARSAAKHTRGTTAVAHRARGEIQFGEQLTYRGQLIRSALTSGPAILWVSLFLLVPLLAVGVISFMTKGQYGVIKLPFTFDNYTKFFGFGSFGFNPLYPQIFLRSALMGAGTTILCILAAFPLAFFIAAMPARFKGLALTLAVIPFWTNLLIRTYAWQLLLAPDSLITKTMLLIGVGTPGAPLYPSLGAVSLGMLAAYLPFLVLPLYTAVEKIDWSIAEAASDLGANSTNVFRHAVLPQVMPGLTAGVILVFIPSMGQYVIPDLLGGAKTVMLGNAIQQQFGASFNWPFGSAIAFLSMAIVMVGLTAYAQNASKKGGGALL